MDFVGFVGVDNVVNEHVVTYGLNTNVGVPGHPFVLVQVGVKDIPE
jgi:hypothetical protein